MTTGAKIGISAVAMTVALTVAGCASSASSTGPGDPTISPQPSSLEPHDSPDISGEPSVSPGVAPSGAITIAFVTPVPKPTWHGKAFTVKAQASDGSAVAYAATGPGVCAVNATSGRVTVDERGKCKITASVVDADPPVTASQSFTVGKAKPVVKFDNSTTRFARPFRYQLPISVTPKIPLKMVVDRNDPRGTNDDFCVVNGDGLLTFDPRPTPSNFPQIPAKCVVRVSATGTANYDAPKAVSRVITIGLADFRVNVAEIVPVTHSTTDGTVTFTIQEGSGDAFGIEVYSNSDADVGEDNYLCEPVSTTPYPAPGGTTRYTATVTLQAPPGGAAYDCEMSAQAVPPDYQGGKFIDNFTIHVEP